MNTLQRLELIRDDLRTQHALAHARKLDTTSESAYDYNDGRADAYETAADLVQELIDAIIEERDAKEQENNPASLSLDYMTDKEFDAWCMQNLD